jgi:hypothetical protein
MESPWDCSKSLCLYTYILWCAQVAQVAQVAHGSEPSDYPDPFSWQVCLRTGLASLVSAKPQIVICPSP